MKALVVYHSKNGTTQKMANEIANHLRSNNAEVKVGSIFEISTMDIENADRLYFGCWTSGLMLFGQKPAKDWSKFVNQIPILKRKKTTLFTTYKIATGSMFKRMKKSLTYRGLSVNNSALKSKNGVLTEVQKRILLESLN